MKWDGRKKAHIIPQFVGRISGDSKDSRGFSMSDFNPTLIMEYPQRSSQCGAADPQAFAQQALAGKDARPGAAVDFRAQCVRRL